MKLLTTVTSIVSLLPVFISHKITNSGGVNSGLDLTNLVPNRILKFKHTPSTEVPGSTLLVSNKIEIRAQCALSSAWFGQQSVFVGSFGGATRLDGSNARQSPRGLHGGERHDSCKVGTQTSWSSHAGVEFPFKQFGKPHQIFEHFALPFIQIHELQLFVSSTCWVWFVSSLSALYGDNVDIFKHTDAGLDSTATQKRTWFIFRKKREENKYKKTYRFHIEHLSVLVGIYMKNHQYHLCK